MRQRERVDVRVGQPVRGKVVVGLEVVATWEVRATREVVARMGGSTAKNVTSVVTNDGMLCFPSWIDLLDSRSGGLISGPKTDEPTEVMELEAQL